MTSREEAKFYLHQCGVKSLDRNQDGVPCESLCR
ncbi:MAG: excalibur calcium-binding domain-containing protein [Gammaproteobacteria bacterium]|nr:excalibur calcium-binding domain-containing protein [Gammaproteobacteria bacterium]MCL5796139.1 excalibur calcium-binding domain-containing protein [Gammaproteobacteria bacterium]